MEYVDADGMRIAYTRSGSGPPVVMLHGASGATGSSPEVSRAQALGELADVGQRLGQLQPSSGEVVAGWPARIDRQPLELHAQIDQPPLRSGAESRPRGHDAPRRPRRRVGRREDASSPRRWLISAVSVAFAARRRAAVSTARTSRASASMEASWTRTATCSS